MALDPGPASPPYIIAFALPVFALGVVGGPASVGLVTVWILLPCVVVFVAALMGIDMIRVPKEMDETRPGGAFWDEKGRTERKSEEASHTGQGWD